MMQAFAVIFTSNLLGYCLFTLLITSPENSLTYFTVTISEGFAFQTICF